MTNNGLVYSYTYIKILSGTKKPAVSERGKMASVERPYNGFCTTNIIHLEDVMDITAGPEFLSTLTVWHASFIM